MMIRKDNTVEGRFKQRAARNLATTLTVLRWVAAGPTRNIGPPGALLGTPDAP
jgi:hypothetical protein